MKEEKSTKGRKPVADPKVSLRVYIPQSHIIKLGGYVALQDDVVGYINRKIKKVK